METNDNSEATERKPDLEKAFKKEDKWRAKNKNTFVKPEIENSPSYNTGYLNL